MVNHYYIPQTDILQLDDLLNRIAQSLQLDQTRLANAERSYRAVSEVIEADQGFFKNLPFAIYPQGSFRIGTTVRPMYGTEFDLDIVIHIEKLHNGYDPVKTLDELYRCLRDHGTYRYMVERKNRCIRLNYANEFHMDILPGYKETIWDPNRLLVPDRSLRSYTPTNPKGYASWFESKYIKQEQILLEKARDIEKLPENMPYDLMQPLQRSVQLIKRRRDIYFQNSPDLATSSIILTTIAGMFYGGQKSEFEAIRSIVNGVTNAVKLNSGRRIEIVNPANPDEKFSDKWENEPKLYTSFIQFMADFKMLWDELEKASGIPGKTDVLKKAFGDSVSLNAIREQSDLIAKARAAQKLGVARSTGLLTAASGAGISTIKPNNFYGS